MVIREVEKPLIEAVLKHCGQNQTKASKVLGLSRSTLRKKVELYDLP
jgi:Fis family transcriptional regulator